MQSVVQPQGEVKTLILASLFGLFAAPTTTPISAQRGKSCSEFLYLTAAGGGGHGFTFN
jgi:hypothetical protein